MTAETVAQHSPGPWRVEVGTRVVSDATAHEVARTDGCSISDCSEPLPIQAIKANARLIAAAPEMVEAGNTLSAYVYSLIYRPDATSTACALPRKTRKVTAHPSEVTCAICIHSAVRPAEEFRYRLAERYRLTDRDGLLLSAGYVEVPWEEVLL